MKFLVNVAYSVLPDLWFIISYAFNANCLCMLFFTFPGRKNIIAVEVAIIRFDLCWLLVHRFLYSLAVHFFINQVITL